MPEETLEQEVEVKESFREHASKSKGLIEIEIKGLGRVTQLSITEEDYEQDNGKWFKRKIEDELDLLVNGSAPVVDQLLRYKRQSRSGLSIDEERHTESPSCFNPLIY